MNTLTRAALVATLFGASHAAQPPAGYFPPPEKQGGWRSLVAPNATPTDDQKREILATTGIDQDRLRKAWEYDLEAVGPDSPKSLLVIRHGWIVFERYDHTRGNIGKDTPVRFASGTKSLVGMCLARLFTQNRCKDTDPVHRYMPASWAAGEPARRKIEIRHILSMSSGLEPYDGPYEPENYGSIITNLAVVATPGAEWFYNTGALDLMNYVIAALSGRPMDEFLNAEIMAPIGAGPAGLRPQNRFDGHGFCSSYALTPRDYARIGYLLLHGGEWAGRRILDRPAVAKLTTHSPWLAKAVSGDPVARPDKPQEHYGYTFWLNRTGFIPGLPKDAYMASGGNHKMIVIPSLDMIVVRVGNYIHDATPVNRAYAMLRQAVVEASPAQDSAAPPSAQVPTGAHLTIEAEDATLVAPMRVETDAGDSRIRYAWTPRDIRANYATPGGPAAVRIAFELPAAAACNIWARTIAPDPHSDSYYLALDGTVIENPWFTLAIPQSKEWRWVRVRTNRKIEAGRHVLEFRHRESGIKLDKVVITSDLSFVP